MYGDFPEAKEEGYDDSGWYTVGLPHSFGTPYFMENDFYVGYGCYRKQLHIESAWLGRRIAVEFQGAFQEAEIYLNGQLAGTHKGGYTAFEVDLTPFVRAGSNLLFVRLNNLWNPRLAPRAGEHVFNGGIYRDVSLIVTDPLHVAWYGTGVTTPEASRERAVVELRTELVNGSSCEADCTLVSTVEYEGETVFETSSSMRLQAGQRAEQVQQGEIPSPRLWHPDTPQLYLLRSRVYRAGVLCDEYETSFGVRWFSFDAKQGFFLNGEHYDIIGANVHQDHAGWSDAVTRAGIARDIKLIKECGMNFIRGSHYPHHTHFAAECDRQGLLFWSELCYWGTGGNGQEGYWSSSAYPVHEEDQPEFEESCLLALQEMIRTNRNHPSLIVWSMSNEPFFSHSEVMDKARALIVRLVDESHRLDSTRPAAVGGAQRQGFDVLGDLAGYNGDGAVLFTDPGFPSFVSEYGSVISLRPGAFAPYYTDGVESNPRWRSGKAIWCGFHHGSILFDMGYMGIIDYYRLPLNSWYWYRQELLGIAPPPPAREGMACALRMSADKQIIGTDGTDDVHLVVEAIDQAGNRVAQPTAVLLEVTEGGGIFPTGRSLWLSTDSDSFLDGMGAIELRSYYAGRITIRASAEGLEPAILQVEAVGGERWDGRHLRMPAAPPSRLRPPRSGESVNIAKNRPVFCSSFEEGYSAMHVTDASANTCWRPNSEREGQWIMVDLEGSKLAERAIIRLAVADGAVPPYQLSCSFDKQRYTLLTEAEPGTEAGSLVVKLPAGGLRYLRLQFPQAVAAVREIAIYT